MKENTGKIIGEIKQNFSTRWNEHESSNKDSEPAKHFYQHLNHVFQWNILMSPLMNNCKKNLETLFIAVKHPTLNKERDSKKLTLFRNVVTCI